MSSYSFISCLSLKNGVLIWCLHMNKSEKESILEKYYFNAKNVGAYMGPQKVFSELNKKYPGLISLYFIKKWLNNQDAYSLQKQPRYRYKTVEVRVSGVGEQLDMDLLSMMNLADDNDGVKYLLFAIDVFSRKIWVKPLKNKTAKSVLSALKGILDEVTPKKIRSDKGSEFANRWFKKFCKDRDIYCFTTNNPAKANYVERVQRTIKTALYRMMRHQRKYRYIDELDDIVASYNASPHRSLGNLAPNDVNKKNEANVWAHLYLKKRTLRKSKPSFKFNIGDFVRISFLKQPFQRAYQEHYTTEVFKVSNRLLKQGHPMYRLKDLKNEKIKGMFYGSELQKVDKDENSLWFIKIIITKRQRNGKLQYFVKWHGFDNSFSSWIDANEVKDTTV